MKFSPYVTIYVIIVIIMITMNYHDIRIFTIAQAYAHPEAFVSYLVFNPIFKHRLSLIHIPRFCECDAHTTLLASMGLA